MNHLLVNITGPFKGFITFCALVLIGMTCAHAQITIYTAGNSLLESVEQADKKQQLFRAQEVLAQLSSGNTLEHGIARLLLAKQFNLAKRAPEAITQIVKAIDILTGLNQPVHLANAVYTHAMTLAIYQRQYQSSVAVFAQVIDILESAPASTAQDNKAFNELLFAANNRLGSLHLFLNDSGNALKYLKKAEQLARATENVASQTTVSMNLAKYYTNTGNTELAEQYLIDNYRLASASDDYYALATSLLHISQFYRTNQRHKLAIDYALKAEEAASLSKDESLHANTYNNLAVAYEESGDDNLALVHYLNVITVLDRQPDHLFIALAQHNIGETYVRLGQYDKAFKYLTKANQQFKEIGHEYYELTNNIALAKLLALQNNYQQAINYATKGLTAAKSQQQHQKILSAHRILAEVYQLTGQSRLANEHYIEISTILEEQKQQLEKKLQQKKSTDNQLEMVSLKQSVLDLAQSKLKLLQQKNDSESRELALSALSITLFFVFCILLIIKQRKIATVVKLLDSYQQHGFSGLQRLTTDIEIDNVIRNELKQFQYLVVIDIPVLANMHKHMSIATAKQLQTNWLTSIKSQLNSDIFHLNDSTLVTALNVKNDQQRLSESSQRQLTFESIADEVANCMPEQLIGISKLYKANSFGVVERNIFNQANISLSPLSTLELALSALCASQFISDKTSAGSWAYLSPKPNTHSAMFSGGDREQWLNSIELNLIKVEVSQPSEILIPWRSFNI